MSGYQTSVLRLVRAIAARSGDDSFLDFTGPSRLKEQIWAEEPSSGDDLLRAFQELEAAHGDLQMDADRARYLAAQLHALVTVARRLRGESLPMEAEASACFDIDAGWIADNVLDAAAAMLDDALAGTGPVRDRLRAWRERYTLPADRAHLLDGFLHLVIDEARRRTTEIVNLPDDEELTIEAVHDVPVRAMAAYEGRHRSRLLMNPDVPCNLAELLYVCCHETYPGHLAEAITKDDERVAGSGFLEEQLRFLMTPPFVISEGLALVAHEIVFPDDGYDWLATHIFPAAGVVPDGADLQAILRAIDILYASQCNAAILLRNGSRLEEVTNYLVETAHLDPERASRVCTVLQRPFAEAYTFTYYHGRQLVDRWLATGPRRERFRTLLTSQHTPSQLLDAAREHEGAEHRTAAPTAL
jgi:hypothetical protein